MNLFNILKLKQFEEMFEKALEEEFFKPQSKSEIYNEISNYYFVLLSLLKIDNFNSFNFPDYDDCRKIEVDGNEYDFDDLFCHDNEQATDALCAIDCLISDLEEDNLEKMLKKIEKTINVQNQKIK